MFESIKQFFENLYQAFISGRITYPSLKEVANRVIEVFYAPSADPVATIMSSLFLINIFAILLVIVLWIVLKRNDDRVLKKQRKDFNEQLREVDPEGADEIIHESAIESRWFVTMMGIAMIFALFLGVNFATANNKVCVSCHKTTVHEVNIVKTGPHKNADCVSCHEPAGFMARTMTSLLPRIAHIAKGAQVAQQAQSTAANASGNTSGVYTSSDGVTVDTNAVAATLNGGYGGVSTRSCTQCHDNLGTGVLTNETTGIRVQHKEPMEQGSKCTDCHSKGSSGQIVYTQKMDSCIMCHDGKKAPSDCSTCHTKNFAAGSAARVKPVKGTEHSLNMNCYTCHNPARCDACHGGVRMPHSQKFMTTGLHAYDGASAIWNKTTKCSKCHDYKTECGKCHGTLPYHAKVDPSFPVTHKNGMFENKPCGLCHFDFNPGTKYKVKENEDVACVSCHSTKGASKNGAR